MTLSLSGGSGDQTSSIRNLRVLISAAPGAPYVAPIHQQSGSAT